MDVRVDLKWLAGLWGWVSSLISDRLPNLPTTGVTRAQWETAIRKGFISDGSTGSPDLVYGVLIANPDNRWPPLPANLHDYRYHLGGTEEDKQAADAEFLRGLYDCVDHLPGQKRKAARRRCRVYYTAVKTQGHRFWAYRSEPEKYGGIT